MSSYFSENRDGTLGHKFVLSAVFLYLACSMLPKITAAQDRSQMRSMVISRGGIVAAESPFAAQAGARILSKGGNAVDAAIATNAMMGVVSPMMNGMGGDLFAIVYDAKANKLYGLNSSGWAPQGSPSKCSTNLACARCRRPGVHTITVPGAVEGWQKLADKFGRRSCRRTWLRRFRPRKMVSPSRSGWPPIGPEALITCAVMMPPPSCTCLRTKLRK